MTQKKPAKPRAQRTAMQDKICAECDYLFSADELAAEDNSPLWGHPCHVTLDRRERCESFRRALNRRQETK